MDHGQIGGDRPRLRDRHPGADSKLTRARRNGVELGVRSEASAYSQQLALERGIRTHQRRNRKIGDHDARDTSHRNTALAACGNSSWKFFAIEMRMHLGWNLNWINERANANTPPRPAHLVARDHRVDRESVEHYRRAGSEPAERSLGAA